MALSGTLAVFSTTCFRPSSQTRRARDAVNEQARQRALRWFARGGLLDPGDARAMHEWANSGCSADASVRIAAHHRAGLDNVVSNDRERAPRDPAGVEQGWTAWPARNNACRVIAGAHGLRSNGCSESMSSASAIA